MNSRPQASESTQLVWQGCFFFLYSLATFDDQLSKNFHRLVILCTCWDTTSEKTGLWQLPKVSKVFNCVISKAVVLQQFILETTFQGLVILTHMHICWCQIMELLKSTEKVLQFLIWILKIIFGQFLCFKVTLNIFLDNYLFIISFKIILFLYN